jgi:deoxycytidine triphosphate deaminase
MNFRVSLEIPRKNMILTNIDILARMAAAAPLLRNHDAANIGNCNYVLRAGKVFAPQSGDEVVLAVGKRRRALVWEIGPSETLIVMTEEIVQMPDDLCATYAPLNRLAQQGVMLLNAAIVEPGYVGPLSCVLLNFSSRPVSVDPKGPVAKIVFHSLTQPVANPPPDPIDRKKYARGLVNSAKSFQRSFLDVREIADLAAKKARSSIKGSIIGAGVFVGLLVLFATIEPITSKWLLEKTGVTTTTQRVGDTALRDDTRAAESAAKSATEQLKLQSENAALQKQIQELKAEVDRLQRPVKGRPVHR